jgi:hypothetical protein
LSVRKVLFIPKIAVSVKVSSFLENNIFCVSWIHESTEARTIVFYIKLALIIVYVIENEAMLQTVLKWKLTVSTNLVYYHAPNYHIFDCSLTRLMSPSNNVNLVYWVNTKYIYANVNIAKQFSSIAFYHIQIKYIT